MDLEKMRAKAEANKTAARTLLASVKSPKAQEHARNALAQADRQLILVAAMEKKLARLIPIRTEMAEAADDLARCQGKAARAQNPEKRRLYQQAAAHHQTRLANLAELERRALGPSNKWQSAPPECEGGSPTD